MALQWVLGNFADGSINLSALPVVDGSDSATTDILGDGSADITLMTHELSQNMRNNWKGHFAPWLKFIALVDPDLPWNHVGAVAWAGPITNAQMDIATQTLRVSATELNEYLDRRRVTDMWGGEFLDLQENTIPEEWENDGETSPTRQDRKLDFQWRGAGWRDVMIKVIRSAFYLDLIERVPAGAPVPPKIIGTIPPAASGNTSKSVLRIEGRTYGEILREIRDEDSPNGLEWRFRPRFRSSSRARIAWDVLVGTDEKPHINEATTYGLILEPGSEKLSSFNTTTTGEHLFSKFYLQELDQNKEFVVWDRLEERHTPASKFPILLEDWLDTGQPLTSTEFNSQMAARMAHAAKHGEEVSMDIEEQWGVGRWAPRLGGTLVIEGVKNTKSSGILNVVRIVGYTINPSDGTCQVSVMSPQPTYPKLPGRPLARPKPDNKGKGMSGDRTPHLRGRIDERTETTARAHFVWTPTETEQDIRLRTNTYPEWSSRSGIQKQEHFIELSNPGWAELKVRQRMVREDGSTSEWSPWSETVKVDTETGSGGPGGPGTGDDDLAAPVISRAEQKDTRVFFKFERVLGGRTYEAYTKKNGGDWDIPDIQEPGEDIVVKGKEGDVVEFRVRAKGSRDDKVSEWATASVTMVGMPELPTITDWRQEGPRGVVSFLTASPDATHAIEFRVTNGEWTPAVGELELTPPDPDFEPPFPWMPVDDRHRGKLSIPAPDDVSLQARLRTENVAGESEWVYTEYIPIAKAPNMYIEQHSAPLYDELDLPEWLDGFPVTPPPGFPFPMAAEWILNFSQSDTAESTRVEARLNDDEEWTLIEGLEPNKGVIRNAGQMRDELPEAYFGNIITQVGAKIIMPGDTLQVRARAEHEDGYSDWATAEQITASKPDGPDIYKIEQEGSWAVFYVRPNGDLDQSEMFSGDYRLDGGPWKKIGDDYDPKEPVRFRNTGETRYKFYSAEEPMRVLAGELIPAEKVEVRIRGYNKSGWGLYSQAELIMEPIELPEPPVISTAESRKEQAVFIFDEVFGAHGYQAQYRVNEGEWRLADGLTGAFGGAPQAEYDSIPGKLYFWEVEYGDVVEFRVRARNFTEWSEWATASVELIALPGDEPAWWHEKFPGTERVEYSHQEGILDGKGVVGPGPVFRFTADFTQARFRIIERGTTVFSGGSNWNNPITTYADWSSRVTTMKFGISASGVKYAAIRTWDKFAGDTEVVITYRTVSSTADEVITLPLTIYPPGEEPEFAELDPLPDSTPAAPEWVDIYTNAAGDSGVVVFGEAEFAEEYELQVRVDGGDWEDVTDYEYEPNKPVAVGDITEQVVELRVRATNILGAGEWSTIAEFESVLKTAEDLPMPVVHGRKEGENALFYYDDGEMSAPQWWDPVTNIPDPNDYLPDTPKISASSYEVRVRIEGSDPRALTLAPGEEYVVDRIKGARVLFEVRAFYSGDKEDQEGWSPWASRVIHG